MPAYRIFRIVNPFGCFVCKLWVFFEAHNALTALRRRRPSS